MANGFKQIRGIPAALVLTIALFATETANAALARQDGDTRQIVTATARDQTGKLWPRLRRFLVLIGFSDDMIGPRP